MPQKRLQSLMSGTLFWHHHSTLSSHQSQGQNSNRVWGVPGTAIPSAVGREVLPSQPCPSSSVGSRGLCRAEDPLLGLRNQRMPAKSAGNSDRSRRTRWYKHLSREWDTLERTRPYPQTGNFSRLLPWRNLYITLWNV